MLNNIEETNGALSLIAKFDTIEDDNKIHNMICYAINNGLDIDNIGEEIYAEAV